MTIDRNSLRLRGILLSALMLLFTIQQASAAEIPTNWTGSVSNAYGNAGNWSNGEPTTGYSAFINSATNNPVVTTGGNGYIVDNLTIGSASSMNIVDNSYVEINTANTGTCGDIVSSRSWQMIGATGFYSIVAVETHRTHTRFA